MRVAAHISHRIPNTSACLPACWQYLQCQLTTCLPAEQSCASFLQTCLHRAASEGLHHQQPWLLQQCRLAHSKRLTDDYDRYYDRHHRVNDAIFSRCLNVQFPDGHLAVLNRRDALKAAAQQGLDLVEFKSTTTFEHLRDAGPPFANLVDYKKLRDERRREHQAAVERGRAAAGAGPALADDGSQSGGHGRRQDSMQELHAAMEKGRQAGRAAASETGDNGASMGVPSSTGSREDLQGSRAEASGRVGRLFQDHDREASSLESTATQTDSSRSSSEKDAGGRESEGVSELGSPQTKKQRQQRGKKEKVKELFFGTKIAPHDIEVRLKKARQWLSDGLKVSIAQEIDNIDSKSAAELALDTFVAKLSEYGRPATAKHSTKSVVSLVLVPKAPSNGLASEAAVSQSSKKGKKQEHA
ncbi:hypothetical protein DUNSADRAFT_3361 [Dunaliella salina]|uniref:Translation initiation factor 3 N-terminal domain-containing protein n=1 Tax=Dunaliella salina TaxID=3046 RepID=A0ABQ7GU20_DUNSA|nr:hypothetical protein DUNSADRAFT_3361 [Dunaliella salina]|eukprot:KAF5838111.1 hypothetical protein DUNSADRAFT_3361 [Dunaliella salina]